MSIDKRFAEIQDDKPYGHFEIVRWEFHDTEPFSNAVEFNRNQLQLTFFVVTKRDPARSNMALPSMLPNPQAFIVSEIGVTGLPEYLKNGELSFVVGNKWYGDFPLDLFLGERNHFVFTPCDILIYPLQCFQVQMRWNVPYNGKLNPDIKVSLIGQLRRPVS